jgi:hypothetical protein
MFPALYRDSSYFHIFVTFHIPGSPSYGEGGYIRVYRAEDESEVCGIQLNPQDNDACEGDHKPRKVCGTCGILSGSSYLRNVELAL